MKLKLLLLLLFISSTVSFLSAAVPPPPPGTAPPCWPPPCIPIDGGIGILMVAGAAYGVKKIYNKSLKK